MAQAAAIAALGDDDHLAEVVCLATLERARMDGFLRGTGMQVAASRANFLFFACGGDAVAFAEELLRQGVIVTPWKQSGYDGVARVSIGAAAENGHFMSASPPLLPAATKAGAATDARG